MCIRDRIFALFITIGAFAIAGLASVGAIAFTGFPLLVNGFYHLETPGNALTVSYTHLDVYKRQIQEYDRDIWKLS